MLCCQFAWTVCSGRNRGGARKRSYPDSAGEPHVANIDPADRSQAQ